MEQKKKDQAFLEWENLTRKDVIPESFHKFLSITSRLLLAIIIFQVLYFVVRLAFIYPWLWFVVAFVVISIGISLFSTRVQFNLARLASKRFDSASETIKADHLGRAIHVAGHPLLERDQKVALALKGGRLSIYDEHLEDQLAAIQIDDMRLIYTVVYDDARVPHLKAVDSAAQALQIEFFIGSATYTVLFRSMLDPRPIDWYHALEQARFKSG